MGLRRGLARARHAAPLQLLLLLALAACGKDGSGPAAAGAPARKAARRASSPAALQAGLELRRGREPRELVWIGLRSVVVGPEGGRREWKLFTQPRRAEEAWSFFGSYAPFEMKSPEGDLTFRGHGSAKASSVERRMILQWARQVAAEAAGGRAGDAYGLVLAWHQGGPANLCEDVVLYLTGEAVATACGWEREVRGRLDPAALVQVYEWFDRLQPFQAGDDDPDGSYRSGKLQARLIFAGRGPRFTSPAEQEEIQAFAAALFAELAARRRVFQPQPAAAAPGMPAPPPRLLLPPGAGAGAQEIVLQLPR